MPFRPFVCPFRSSSGWPVWGGSSLGEAEVCKRNYLIIRNISIADGEKNPEDKDIP